MIIIVQRSRFYMLSTNLIDKPQTIFQFSDTLNCQMILITYCDQIDEMKKIFYEIIFLFLIKSHNNLFLGIGDPHVDNR